MKSTLVAVVLVCALLGASPLYGQTFTSGSTGADGALNQARWQGQTVLLLPLPDSGVFHFTTVHVPIGHELRFIRNASNTPVVILASGNVILDGTINVRPPSTYAGNAPHGVREPGPGGFFGSFPGGPGFGPGGGAAGTNPGRWVGPLTLVPIIGGSGGASPCSGGGGGGGGAIVIASSTSITGSGGGITANAVGGSCNGANGGAGGAIRLVANSISLSVSLSALGVSSGSPGVIRLEAPAGAVTFGGSATPAAVISTINPTIVPTSGTPSLTIASIGGFAVPAGAGARPDTVDLLLPTQLLDPIPMVVHAANIPVGSQVTLAINNSPSAAAAPAALAGTDQSSSATLNITGLDRTKVIFLFASVTFEVPMSAQSGNPPGPNQVARLRMDAVPGQPSRVAFLRQDGTEIPPDEAPAAVRTLFKR